MKWQIAIDGPSGAGKSTVAKLLAEKLGFEYLDTGAMYRACTIKALELGIELENEENYKFLEDTVIEFRNHVIFLDGKDVSKEIRSIEVTKNVSLVCSFKYVREKMVELQRKIGETQNIIMDGRDIGTVVLPNANLKVYLDATSLVRGKRRLAERIAAGMEDIGLEETIKEIELRDYKDSHRENSPLCKAEDAVYLDTSDLSVSQVVDAITILVLKRGYKMEENKTVEMNEVQEENVETENVLTEPEVAPAEDAQNTLKDLQLVHGKVVEVLAAEKEIKNKAGEVVRKAKEERVLVELDGGQEGLLFRKDLVNVDDSPLADQFMEGDEIDAVVRKVFPDGGRCLLSQTLLEKRNSLAKFEEIIKNHESFTAKVVKAIQVGLILDYEGYACLLPLTQITNGSDNLKEYIGQEMNVTPIRVDYNRIRLIVSQKVADAIKAKAEKNAFLATVEVGQVYEGTVRNIESYGAFVELKDGVEGLLHISEVEHNRVVKIEKVLKSGDTVKVQVIKVEDGHISLSRKALLPNYWKDFIDQTSVGAEVKGTVAEINNSGIVVNLSENVQGFLPKSEASWERDAKLEEVASVGNELTTKVIELDLNKKRIILSLKQLNANPWEVSELKSGDEIEFTVLEPMADGYKVLSNGLHGYLPNGNVPKDLAIALGQTYQGHVRAFEAARTRLVVTLRTEEPRRAPARENKEVTKYSTDHVSNTFGDFLNLDDYKNLK